MAEYFLNSLMSFTPETFLLIFGGVVVGMIFGALPGLSTTMAIALFLPMTFRMGIEPGTAFEDIPDDWVCPLCGVGKDDFEPYEE